jgi:DNA-binding transcriptional regulator YhcF (GntR family)
MTTSEQPVMTCDEELEQGYYVQAASKFWRSEKFSLTAKGLYTLLLTYAGKSDEAWPGQELLSKSLGISENTLRLALKELKENGLISIKRNGQGQPNTYHLHKFSFRTSNSEVQETQPEKVKNLKNRGSRTSNSEQELYTDKLNTNSNIKDKGDISPQLPPIVNLPIQIAIIHWHTLQKNRPKGADDSWFNLLVKDYPLDRVLAGLTLSKELGCVQSAAQVRKVIQNMSAKERSQFDNDGHRIRSNNYEQSERRSTVSANGSPSSKKATGTSGKFSAFGKTGRLTDEQIADAW